MGLPKLVAEVRIFLTRWRAIGRVELGARHTRLGEEAAVQTDAFDYVDDALRGFILGCKEDCLPMEGGMPDPTIPAGFPGWYQFFKDFVALWVSIVGLTAAIFAYRSAMAKVNYDREVAKSDRTTSTMLARIQIAKDALVLCQTCKNIVGANDLQELEATWNTTLRHRCEANAQMINADIDRLIAAMPEYDVAVAGEVAHDIGSLQHWAFVLANILTRFPKIDDLNRDSALSQIAYAATLIYEDMVNLVPTGVDIEFTSKLPYDFLDPHRPRGAPTFQ